MTDLRTLSERIAALLSLSVPPLAISFCKGTPEGVEPFAEPMPAPTADGRTGRVPAGCVFWMKGVRRTFSTVAADHANCSVGSVTHGFKGLAEAAGQADVATLVESGWVSPEAFPDLPAVAPGHTHVVYGPLAESPLEPDVVLLRVQAKQAMMLADAIPEMRFEGKPQCHIIAIARERGEPATSVGCMLSRVRTGMGNSEMTCALPGRRLGELVDRLERACRIDNVVAAYASDDARRFRGNPA